MGDYRQCCVKINGCEISLKRGGIGPPMLYLHGAAGAGAWLPFMEILAGHFDLIVPEHPGFGTSETPDWLDNIHDLAYFYLDFIRELRLRDFHLVGGSLGGWIALELAVRCSCSLKSLTVCSPGGIYVKGLPLNDPFLWDSEESVRNLFHNQEIADRLLETERTEEEKGVALKNHFTTARLAWSPRNHDPHLYKWLHRIDVPTHIIWGKQDQLIPAEYAKELQKLIPNSRVTLFDQCGHLPQTEKTTEYCQSIIDAIGDFEG